jgi:iron(III) transport system ATP-binding protein
MRPIDMVRVSARNLVVRYDDKVAVDHVDLVIEPGELFCLLGPSGCGKTTLLRAIAGLVAPDSGAILFDERDVTRLAPHLRKTGMVFQSFALWPHLSVGDNVAFGLREQKVPREKRAALVKEALTSVRLPAHAERRVEQLSGGEQQRVALARALVVRPECLLLDEPLSNLDANLRHGMRDEIRRMCKEFGLTTIYVTHDQKEALAIADRLAVMQSGVILQVGSPAEVYRRPSSRAVATFLGETNLLPGVVSGFAGGPRRVSTAVGELVTSSEATGAQPDERVWVSIRPECLTLRDGYSAEPPPNALVGTIASSTYLGEPAEHRFASGDAVLRIFELNPQRRTPGDPAVAAVAPEDVVLLTADEPTQEST